MNILELKPLEGVLEALCDIETKVKIMTKGQVAMLPFSCVFPLRSNNAYVVVVVPVCMRPIATIRVIKTCVVSATSRVKPPKLQCGNTRSQHDYDLTIKICLHTQFFISWLSCSYTLFPRVFTNYTPKIFVSMLSNVCLQAKTLPNSSYAFVFPLILW